MCKPALSLFLIDIISQKTLASAGAVISTRYWRERLKRRHHDVVIRLQCAERSLDWALPKVRHGPPYNVWRIAMRQTRGLTLSAVAFAVSLGALASLAASQARAASDDALQILKGMSDYLASQKSISLTFDSALEAMTPQGEKIQFNSSGTMLLHRPNEIRATRTGGYADVELLLDGKTATLYGKNLNSYVQLDGISSVDQLIDVLRERGMSMPGADLLVGNVYDTLSADVIDAKHIGRGVIEGNECEHLAFRNHDTDWQLWVRVGDKPIPCKYVITSKAVGMAPQYTLTIRDWKTDVPVEAGAFAFTPPDGAKKVDTEALANLDELPPSSPAKGQ